MNTHANSLKRRDAPFYVGETLYHVFWSSSRGTGSYVALYKVTKVTVDAVTFVRVKTKRGCTEFDLGFYGSYLNSVLAPDDEFDADDNQEIGEVLKGKIVPHTWDEFYHIETEEKDNYGENKIYYAQSGFIERYIPD